MNERERLIRTLTCAGPDRPSYGDYFAYDSTRERWEREGLPSGLNNSTLFDHFGMDHTDIWSRDGILLWPRPKPPYEEAVLEDQPDYTLRRKSDGDVVRVLKNTPPPAMPQFVAHPVTDRASWRELQRRLDPASPEHLPHGLAALAAASPTRATPFGVWFGGTYGYIRNWMGVEAASYVFYDDPAWVEEMVAHLTLFFSGLAERIFSAGVQLDWVMFWEDMAYNGGPLLSPTLYERYCLPFYAKLIDLVRAHGVRVIGLDSDGNTSLLIPLWVDAGINVLHPMEAAAGMDVRITRRQYGTRVAFLGGIDKRALSCDRAAIDAEVIPKVNAMLDSGGGLLAEVDHGIPPDISYSNYCYFRDLVRSLCER
jgi:hypothetical protein